MKTRCASLTGCFCALLVSGAAWRTHDVFGKLRVKNASSVIDIGCSEFFGSGLSVFVR